MIFGQYLPKAKFKPPNGVAGHSENEFSRKEGSPNTQNLRRSTVNFMHYQQCIRGAIEEEAPHFFGC